MQSIKDLLDQYPQYREKLYIRGFLLSKGEEDESVYPYYGAWKPFSIGSYRLLVHPLQHICIRNTGSYSVALVGHAMDPFALEANEAVILDGCLEELERDEASFWNRFNQLTGVFTCFVFHEDRVWIIGDASGMQTTFYAVQNGKLFVSSHTMMLGEQLGLKKDPYIDRLIRYRFFPLLGNALPGDRTQFVGLTRVTPNICTIFENGEIRRRRFFTPYRMPEKSKEELAKEAGELINRTLVLVAQKWKKPAISLTGGCDSKTTLACARGVYDRFQYYSYSSSPAEQVDCEAAGIICQALGLEHTVYSIPNTLPDHEVLEVVARILRWNCGDILDSNPNDVRKRIVLDEIDGFDVEVKSWASEIGRAYYSKRFHGRTKFPVKPSGRACTTLYKFFLHDRKLVRETDKVFEGFIREYYQAAEQDPIPWFEQFFWEFRVPAWNGLVITGEHRYSSDITIPYNNRLLLTILLSVPIEERITDALYTEIRKQFQPKIDAAGVSVTNLHHTERREKLENLYWLLHTAIPY